MFFIIVIFFLFFIPQLRINNIAIAGADGKAAKDLENEIKSILQNKYYYIIPKDHLFFYPRDEIEALLEKKFRVQKFGIDKDYPSALKISISEREPWALWCSAENQGKCLLIDRDGFAFENAPLTAGTAVLKIIDARNSNPLGKNILPEGDFSLLRFFIEEIPKNIDEKISSVNIKASGKGFLIYFKTGWYAFIDNETDKDKAIQNVNLALNNSEIKDKRSKLEYIDLRFEDKVFYKFK